MYRATNVALGRKVAIKLLSSEFVNIESDVLRFLREARAAAAVRHVNVVDVFDVARDDDGTPFIVQELLSGEDLEHYLRQRGKLSAAEALEIMIPVADAVAAAHARDVVHRDLKPANIFLAREGNQIVPKVLDFGACLFPTIAERSAKEIRLLIGTPHYMAPEQIVKKAEVGARADVWAIGVILYEMIVGETPFEADTADAVLERVKTRDVPPLGQVAKDAPAALETLVARCMRREQRDRIPDAGALHVEMRRVRDALRGVVPASRFETLPEMPAQQAPAAPAPKKKPAALSFTLNSPGSEPPGPLEPPPTPAKARPEMPAKLPPVPAKAARGTSAPSPEPPSLDLELDAPFQRRTDSSLPPVLDPRALATRSPEKASEPTPLEPSSPEPYQPFELDLPEIDEAVEPAPPFPLRREPSPQRSEAVAATVPLPAAPLPASSAGSGEAEPPSSPRVARPPAMRVPEPGPGRTLGTWTPGKTAAFVGAVVVPALILFGLLAVVPIGAPLGRALRGDSTLASGVLTVVALVVAAALCAKSFLGERDRWTTVAAVGSVLFGIVMIIVTSSASEAAELGVPSTMGGLSTMVAPFVPLALGIGAASRARTAWLDPYAKSEAIRFTALASLMLLLLLAVSPVGVVRAVTHRGANSTYG